MLGDLFVYLWGSAIACMLGVITHLLIQILKRLEKGPRLDYFNDDEED